MINYNNVTTAIDTSKLIKKYVDAGVNPDKMVITNHPSVCIWSTSRKCLVGENGIPTMEIIYDESDNGRLSYENNYMINLICSTQLSKKIVNKINKSDGIIITEHETYFRYNFIPVNTK